MIKKLTLVSHVLCPYVQRAVIALKEKKVEFERIDIDLANKPDWFLKISPLGKTPVLLVDGQPIFESAVICEYLEDTQTPALHPADPLQRARHRSWMEFASATLNAIGGLYGAQDAKTFDTKAAEINSKFRQLEAELTAAGHQGPFFDGATFRLVDGAFGPVFRYFDIFDTIGDFGVFTDVPRVRQWRSALQRRPSVRDAVQLNYPDLLHAFLLKRNSEISRRMQDVAALTA
ncbi:glutathione S-transferase [Chitinimonas prasina]|uniref:glutathione transferase n=1 Tax=Chitinimonas prasina TaxID=1434937 RepID=A0ABQ5YIG0_9NEIS|nr:glutathione S-transferase family protein [Chitinimonas prasina]GLR13463.1 glutathione S-transferase [Chitinimonas prasina]